MSVNAPTSASNADRTAVDTLIHASWVAPVTAGDPVLSDYCLAIKAGQILDLLPSAEAERRYTSQETFELPSHLLIPGLINAHGHAAMSLFRGLADDLPLQTWLNDHIWPAEAQWVNDEFIADGVQLAMAEMLLGGITCFSDMYFYPEVSARVAAQAKMRAQILMPLIEFPTNWSASAQEGFHKGLQVHDDYRNHELISIGFGPHATYTVSDETLNQVRMLSDELDVPVQIHLHETANEVEQAITEQGQRPIERLRDLNLLSPRLQCVHMTQLSQEDIALVSDNGVSVVHCPRSNLKLASGICPTQALLDEGINVALGTDGAASNNSLSLLSEMNFAALIGKVQSNNAAALSAHQVLRMATLNGAKALGIDDLTGSLEVGKTADITAIDLSALQLQPLYDPVSQLVYAANGEAVSHVWVAGQALVSDRQLLTLDAEHIKSKSQSWQQRISSVQ